MADASRDQNFVPTLIAVLNTNGTTIVPVEADSTTHGLAVANASTGSDFGGDDALRDSNRVPVLIAVSSVDGVTPVPVYADVDGHLLIDSN